MKSDGSIDDCAEKCVSSFKSMDSEMSSTTKVKRLAEDRMTDLINFQKSNGAFEISSESWKHMLNQGIDIDASAGYAGK